MDWIEIIAAALGLIGIGLQIKQSHWYWLTSILMVLLYIYVFYNAKFYADMSFQFYYLAVSIYGWYLWLTKRGDSNSDTRYTVNKLNGKQWAISLIVSQILFAGIYFILKCLTDSPIPAGDAFTTALSIIATWLLAKKYIENWLFWIVVDAVSTALYIVKGLYPTAILFAVLTVLAVVGYFKWRKEGAQHA